MLNNYRYMDCENTNTISNGGYIRTKSILFIYNCMIKVIFAFLICEKNVKKYLKRLKYDNRTTCIRHDIRF